MCIGSTDKVPQRFVVAGNGPSLAQTPAGTVRLQDFVIRVNNFFLEPSPYLGTRVDLAFMGGDPFVAPLMFESLYRRCPPYDLCRWSSHNPKIITAGTRRFRHSFHAMTYRDTTIEREVGKLISGYGKHPMTGTYAVLMAHGLGAQEIVLTGFDFYENQPRYSYHPGANMRALLGGDIATRGVDFRLHDPRLDLEILQMLKDCGDVCLWRAVDSPLLRAVTELLPNQSPTFARAPVDTNQQRESDWVPRSGLRHVKMLQSLKRGRRYLRVLASR